MTSTRDNLNFNHEEDPNGTSQQAQASLADAESGPG